MYDTLTTSYTFSCPVHGETHVRLSRFRRLEELPGRRSIRPSSASSSTAAAATSIPASSRHDELDWAPLGLDDSTPFLNLMTSRVESLGVELGDARRARRSRRGSGRGASSAGPRSGRGRSSRRRSGCSRRRRRATASGSRCAAPCAARSRSTSSRRAHVDVPFVNDREVGVVEHLFARRRRPRRSTSSTPSCGRRSSTPAAWHLSSALPPAQGSATRRARRYLAESDERPKPHTSRGAGSLLVHCAAVADDRQPAYARLEQALGGELRGCWSSRSPAVRDGAARLRRRRGRGGRSGSRRRSRR